MANYCSNCGNKITLETSVKVEEEFRASTELTKKFKPKFVFWYAFLGFYFSKIYILLFIPFWACGFIGGFSQTFIPSNYYPQI